MKPWPRFMEIALFPIRSVVISYIDLLHSTNFLELIPLRTTAALLEKHPVLIIQLAAKQKPASPMVCCTRGQLPPKPLLPSTTNLLSSTFYPPLACPSARTKDNLASPHSLYKHLQMVTEFSLPGLWLSGNSQLKGCETSTELSHDHWGSFSVFFSSLGHSCTQCQN